MDERLIAECRSALPPYIYAGCRITPRQVGRRRMPHPSTSYREIGAHVVRGLADASWEHALLALSAQSSYGAASSSAAW
jgi:hypothetical protein